MSASYSPESYRYDSLELHKTLIGSSLVRTIAYNNIRGELDYDSDDKYRFEELKDDSNPQISLGESMLRRADFSLEYTDKNVPAISEGLSYSRKDLAKIQGTKFPLDERVRRIITKMGETEERFFMAGDPKLGSTTGTYELTNANNQTAATTNFDTQTVTTMRTSLGGQIGQLIDVYGSKLKNYPLFLVVSPDVYKEIIGVANANTDRSAVGLLTQDLKEYGLETTGYETHVFVSDYLFGQAGDIDFDGKDVVLGNAGTEASALICGDPNAWQIVMSPIFQGAWAGARGSIDVEIGYAMLPYFYNDDAIIYDDNVELAAQ